GDLPAAATTAAAAAGRARDAVAASAPGSADRAVVHDLARHDEPVAAARARGRERDRRALRVGGLTARRVAARVTDRTDGRHGASRAARVRRARRTTGAAAEDTADGPCS